LISANSCLADLSEVCMVEKTFFWFQVNSFQACSIEPGIVQWGRCDVNKTIRLNQCGVRSGLWRPAEQSQPARHVLLTRAQRVRGF
jgi:hypothetical protein